MVAQNSLTNFFTCDKIVFMLERMDNQPGEQDPVLQPVSLEDFLRDKILRRHRNKIPADTLEAQVKLAATHVRYWDTPVKDRNRAILNNAEQDALAAGVKDYNIRNMHRYGLRFHFDWHQYEASFSPGKFPITRRAPRVNHLLPKRR